MNRLASQAYKFRAVDEHPAHGAFKNARTEYGVAIKRAKEQHWQSFLEEITGTELWTAHRYVTSPIGDGGKARIPLCGSWSKMAQSTASLPMRKRVRRFVAFSSRRSLFNRLYRPGPNIRAVSCTVSDHPWLS